MTSEGSIHTLNFSRVFGGVALLNALLFAACQSNEPVLIEPIQITDSSSPAGQGLASRQVNTAIDSLPENPDSADIYGADDEADEVDVATSEAEVINRTKISNQIDQDEQQNSVPVEEKHINITDNQIPMAMNQDVKKWIDYFSKKNPEMFGRYVSRGNQYKGLILDLLRKQGVPIELYYLAMIESGFTTSARSRASAVGIWQFIRPTGRRYGLRINRYVDERQDPMRSTIAASLYLQDLHNVFNNWYLAMAAYNAGESRIMNAIMGGNSRDFWELARKRKLPRETMNYTPKFIAATTVGNAPDKYGIKAGHSVPVPKLVGLTVPAAVRMSDIASQTGISLSNLKRYNPHILRGVTPPGGDYKIWVPASKRINTASVYGNLKGKRIALRRVRSERSASSGKVVYHRVRRGENLNLIARRYGTTIRSIKRLNGMRSSRIYAGKRLKVSGSSYSKKSKSSRKVAKVSRKTYRVKRGDNLFNISRKFGISVKRLKQINSLRRNRIYVGQLLRVASNRSG